MDRSLKELDAVGWRIKPNLSPPIAHHKLRRHMPDNCNLILVPSNNLLKRVTKSIKQDAGGGRTRYTHDVRLLFGESHRCY